MGDECYLVFVLFSHFDLIITREPIHKGEEHVGHGVINQGVDMWQWKVVLGASPVQILIVDTHVYFPIFLRHENNVGGPV